MEQKVINYIKCLAIDMIDQAKSGHPGIVLSAAPMMYAIYANHLRLDVNDLSNDNRDRFVMSAGHGSALLYATLYMFGVLNNREELINFRSYKSITPGHPENFLTPGVEMTTGPLGQGIAGAVGMAIAAKYKGNNNRVYVLVSDGDLMEGVSYEALSLAGNLELDNLIVLYDSNDVTLDGDLRKAFIEDIEKRFSAINFNYYKVKDGNDFEKINEVIEKSKKALKPALIEVKTIIGDGTSVAGTSEAHGKPLSNNDILSLKKEWQITTSFVVPEEIRNYAIYKLKSRGSLSDISLLEGINLKINFTDLYKKEEAMRNSASKILQRISDVNSLVIGGSADVGTSTKTYFPELKDFNKENYNGKNIWYGVREHAMGTITNGLALSGLYPYCSTFLAFADYMKPAIRQAAIMNIPSVFVFTHDSINIGADGPTHQPIEQLAMLRSIPNLNVFRPADVKEITGSFKKAFSSKNPSAIVLSRNKAKKIAKTKMLSVNKGAYILRKEKDLHGIIIATGSEVNVALQIANELYDAKKIDLRVVSMPCRELFENQAIKYQEKIIPKGIRKIVLEASCSFGWEGYVYDKKYLITINHFGVSASSDDVLKHCNFDYKKIKKRILNLFI